jgi:predicted PurR-regulated permease PerM
MTINAAYWPWIILASTLALAMYCISGIFLPFVSGLFIAYAMHPMVSRIQDLGVRRSIATVVLLLSFFLVLGALLFVLIPFIAVELVSLAGSLPSYGHRAFSWLLPYLETFSSMMESDNFVDLQAKASSYLGEMFSWALTFVAKLLSNTLALANLIMLIVITPVVAFYMLRDWPLLLEQVSKLLPRKQVSTVLYLATQINNTLGSYVRGQALVCLILAVIYSIGLWAVGLKYAFALGVVTGLLSFIPYVGVVIGMVAGMGIAFSQFDSWASIMLVVAVFVSGNVIEGQVLSPNLVGGRIGLHPVWVIFALLAGGSLLGFIGMLLALPTAAIVGVLVRFVIARYLESPLYFGEVESKKVT